MAVNRPIVVLDACVLAPMPVVDTLLRLAEEPGFYEPRWSLPILDELRRTLAKIGVASSSIDRRIQAMNRVFPCALIQDFEDLQLVMTNHPKDRHVLAAAVKGGAHMIVSDNRKHFPSSSLIPYRLECLSAEAFLELQFRLDSDTFVRILNEQAAEIHWTLPQLLALHVPTLTRLLQGRR